MESILPETVTIRILGRDYKLRCHPNERDALITAAQRLDAEMRVIRDQGQTIGSEKVAIMAALKVAHELVQLQERHTALQDRLSQRLKNLNQIMDTVLIREESD